MSYFTEKNVLITGGASGIGYLMGQKVLERGAAHLIIWDINEEGLNKVAEKWRAQGYKVTTNKVDVGDKESVSNAAQMVLQKVGPVEVLINNAGIVTGKQFEDQSMDEIQKTMQVNSLGLMYVARAFLPAMNQNKLKGYIVNIASAAGLTPNPGMTVYAGSKWAAVGWSESLQLELKKKQSPVRVLTVMPGYIDTGMFEGVKAPLLMPLIDPEVITTKILDAVEKGKTRLREPYLVKLTPFLRGILPSSIYDFVAGKIFRVYDSMDTFKGRKSDS